MEHPEQMIQVLARIGADPDVKALVINQGVTGTLAAVENLLESRPDIFVALIVPQEDPADVAAAASLIVTPDDLSIGPAMIKQAQALGAKTFVHYSFPRHLSVKLIAERLNLMRETCAELGMEFVDAECLDPLSEVGLEAAQRFILEDVPQMVERYGKDTAFFATNCGMQTPLIKSVVEQGAIYPQPCCPSPYHGFPTALGLVSEDYEDEMPPPKEMIAETTKILAQNGMLGRVSNWPTPAATINTMAAAEYAIRWINKEVPQEGPPDQAVLAQCIQETTGVDITLREYNEADGNYPNYQYYLLDYITYGE
jgi:hypothetical protein